MNWMRLSLSQITTLGPQYGANVRAIPYSGGPLRYVRITDIDDNGRLREDSRVEPDSAEVADYLLEDGDLLLARSGATVGKSYLYSIADGPCVFGGYLIRFRPNRHLIEPKYLAYYFQTSEYWAWVEARKRVAAQPNVNGADYASLTLPVPALSEQRRIIENIDQVHQLRRLRVEADVKAERILLALFFKMFGDPTSNPMKWTLETMGNVIADTQYGTSARANNEGLGVPIIRMNNILSSGALDLTRLKFVDLEKGEIDRLKLLRGDLLFNRTNSVDLVGKTGLWVDDYVAVAASYLIRIRVRDELVCPEYLWAFMNTRFMKALLMTKSRRAVGMANINATEVRSLPIMLPPLERQRLFAAHVRSLMELDSLRELSHNRISDLIALVVQRAFRGDLTVSWRDAHIEQIRDEINQQAMAINLVERTC